MAAKGSKARMPAAAPPVARPRRLWLGLLAAGLVSTGLIALFAPQPAMHPPFDKDRAFKSLERQVGFGPRVPNTAGHRACRDDLVSTLKGLADSVESQNFSRTLSAKKLDMTNVIARWKGAGGKAGILLSAHWDTRPTADQEVAPERRKMPIPGANDGASGVAVLLELARAFKQSPPPVPVMIVLFDGEDYGPGIERMFLGSIYFAEHLPPDVPKRGVLLDMIGDRDLEVPQEFHSFMQAREVVDEVYAAARRVGVDSHFPARTGGAVEDDHLPLQAKGLKVIDLIDFDYGPGNSWWHTLEDTPDKCSATSLKMVGDTLLEWIYSQKKT
jgi:Zn-dependent M28 family amino/carboxypeptidase